VWKKELAAEDSAKDKQRATRSNIPSGQAAVRGGNFLGLIWAYDESGGHQGHSEELIC